jgi:hypothetical protein
LSADFDSIQDALRRSEYAAERNAIEGTHKHAFVAAIEDAIIVSFGESIGYADGTAFMCAIYGTIDPTVKRADDGAVIGSIEGSNECSFFDAIESAVGTANEAADGRTVITSIYKSVVAAV